jgi:hypothetical protein
MSNRVMRLQTSPGIRAALIASVLGFVAYLMNLVWNTGWAAAENMMNATEAGTTDTVSSESWLVICLGYAALSASIWVLTGLLTWKALSLFKPSERLIFLAFPLALLPLTPLLGLPAPLVPAVVITVVLTLKKEKQRSKMLQVLAASAPDASNRSL